MSKPSGQKKKGSKDWISKASTNAPQQVSRVSGRTIIKPPQFTQQPSSDDEYEDDEEYEEGDEEYEEDEEDDGAYHGVDNDDEDYVEDGLDNGDGVTVKDLMHNNSMLLAFGNDMKEKHDVMQQQHLSQMKEREA